MKALMTIKECPEQITGVKLEVELVTKYGAPYTEKIDVRFADCAMQKDIGNPGSTHVILSSPDKATRIRIPWLRSVKKLIGVIPEGTVEKAIVMNGSKILWKK